VQGRSEEGARNAVVVGRMACRGILLVAEAAAEARGKRRKLAVIETQRNSAKEEQCIKMSANHACASRI
jgi:hypothetical protein